MRLSLRRVLATAAVLSVAAVAGSTLPSEAAGPMPGAIFTTDAACDGTDLNIYDSKDAVYVDGGPAHPGAAGLPDGEYYIQVTEPNGTLLGTSVGAADSTPVVVVNGDFVQCYQLSAIVITASGGVPGYDDTTNPGGEYKVWVSSQSDFASSASKTDNFKVKTDGGTGEENQAHLLVNKFYDANANGLNDDGQLITGWKVNIKDGIDIDRFTPVDAIVFAPDDYVVSEYLPLETNWVPTTPSPVNVSLAPGDSKTVEFGNLCVGAGGGLTLGFWSNKNGQALVGSTDLAMLVALNLRNADGSAFDPATYAAFRTWILGATATNMANMLSAQLAAMELNVFNGKVNGSALIYAPGTTSANSLGFATVNAVMAEANTELGLHGSTLSGSPFRAYQEALKNALDNANNNKTFVQGTPCPFSFAG